jgi:cytochrome P450
MTGRYDYAYVIGNPVTSHEDPSPQAEYTRRADTVAVEQDPNESDKVTLYRMEDILFINRHPDVLGDGAAGPLMFDEDHLLIPLDIEGADHTKFRRLLDPLFAPKSKQSRIAHLEPTVRKLTSELIDGFIDRGEVELYQEFCAPLPSTIFLNMMGMPADDREFFVAFKDAILRPPGNTPEEMGAYREGYQQRMLVYLTEMIDEREKESTPRGDLIGGLMSTEVDGIRLSRAELINIFYLLVIAGLDTVTASLSCLFTWLAQNPEQQQRLRDDPSLVPNAVEELMRYESPVNVGYRYAAADLDLPSGHTIKSGTYMRVCWSSANVDPHAFPEPLTVDFDRPTPRHIGFASGVHRCLGSHLARLELKAAIDEFHHRIGRYTIAAGQEPTFTNLAVRTAVHVPLQFEKA